MQLVACTVDSIKCWYPRLVPRISKELSTCGWSRDNKNIHIAEYFFDIFWAYMCPWSLLYFSLLQTCAWEHTLWEQETVWISRSYCSREKKAYQGNLQKTHFWRWYEDDIQKGESHLEAEGVYFEPKSRRFHLKVTVGCDLKVTDAHAQWWAPPVGTTYSVLFVGLVCVCYFSSFPSGFVMVPSCLCQYRKLLSPSPSICLVNWMEQNLQETR